MECFEGLQQVIKYTFTRKELLERAMTHSSWANEQDSGQDTDSEHNERLEFLGDAVLELCVSERLFAMFPEAREGQLTKLRAKLVSKPSLAEIAKELRLDQYLRLGKGEESQGGRDRHSLLSDAVEALLGAVFLDSGYSGALAVIDCLLAERWPKAAETSRTKDYKSRLQEYTQQQFKERPVYTLAGSRGPEHAKIFEVLLTLPDGTSMEADGPSVKRAEQRVAGLALKRYGVDDDQ